MHKIKEFFARYTAHAHMFGDVSLFNMQIRNNTLFELIHCFQILQLKPSYQKIYVKRYKNGFQHNFCSFIPLQ